MLDKLVDVLLNTLDLLRCWVVCSEGERVVVYTLGRPTRVVGPRDGIFWTGLHLKAPLNVEKDEATSVREEIVTTRPQSILTGDGQRVYVQGAFRLQVLPEKVETYQVTLGEEGPALASALNAAISEVVGRRPLGDLLTQDDEELSSSVMTQVKQDVLTRARKTLNQYGYKLHAFWWVQLTHGRVYRLITGR